MPDYEDYVAEGAFIEEYVAYQARYDREPRESDKVLIRLAVEATKGIERPAIVDIGCSTGNLLRHLGGAAPGAVLVGGEYSRVQLDTCRADISLDGIAFEEMDITCLDDEGRWDVALVNAILYMMDDDQFTAACRSLYRSLKSGGTLLVFDFFHPHAQDIEIIEKSASHPGGLRLRFRPMRQVRSHLQELGFDAVEFAPFEIPVDLDGMPVGDNRSGFEDLNTRTVKDENGNRMLFRGTLHQPWCHLVAKKSHRDSLT